ncbi:STAS domain-containing protein [Planotetraspora sp. GP83]|uniref:STAS domain-containing protein n=1 Tax=Planotetraspora sp. GP83 TaxID=3156264 RepID=UPI003514C5CF
MTTIYDREPGMDSMQVFTELTEPFAVVTVVGDLDATTTAQLHDSIQRARDLSPHLLLDLAGMTFMDSAGIRVLLDAYNHARAHGGSFTLSGPRPSPRKVMELVGLAQYIPIRESLTEALQDGPPA